MILSWLYNYIYYNKLSVINAIKIQKAYKRYKSTKNINCNYIMVENIKRRKPKRKRGNKKR